MNNLTKTIVASWSDVSSNSFSYNLDVDFIPDEVIFKYVSYINNYGEEQVDILHADLVNSVISPIYDGTGIPLNSRYKLNKSVNGSYTFRLFKAGTVGTAPTVARAGSLVVVMEFVKYV